MNTNKLPEVVVKVLSGAAEKVSAAEMLQITTEAEHQKALAFHKDVSGHIDFVVGKTDPIKKSLKKSHTDFIALVREDLSPFREAKQIVGDKIAEWQTAVKKAQEEAIAKATREAEDKKIEDAEAMGEYGLDEEADKILEKTVRIDKKAIAPAIDRGGTYTVETFKVKSIQAHIILDAAIAGKAPKEFLMLNIPAINKAVKEAKTEGEVFPGVIAEKHTRLASRG